MPVYYTSENNKVETLKTRWYVNNYEQCKTACLEIAKVKKLEIISVNDEFRELFMKNNKYEFIITITSFNARETSIDFRVVSKSFLDFGKGRKEIVEYYQYLDKKLKFKGVALHP